MDQAHVRDARDLLGVGLDPSLGYYEPEENASGDPEDAFFGVQSGSLGPEALECFIQVGHKAACLPGFDHDVIYVSLYRPAYEVPEDLEHTPLVCSPCVLKAERHGYVAKHSKRGDERSRELVRLFHLNLVVSGIRIKERRSFTPRDRVNYLVDTG